MSEFLAAIDRALDADDVPAAARLAEQAYAAGSRDPIVSNLLAWQCEEEGRFEEAESLILEALDREPSDPTLRVGLGVVRRKMGQLREAVDCFEQAIELDPAYASAWYERGATFERGGAIGDAADDYRQALRIEPDNPQFLASLATVCARRGELEEAERHARTALAIHPGTAGARRALAQIAIEQKRFDDAATELLAVNAEMDDAGSGLYSLLGDAYEGLGRYDEAFDAYQRGKLAFLEVNRARLVEAGPEQLLSRLEQTAACFAQIDKAAWFGPDRPASSVAKHVFLLGHPRSGTTLAENILASLPDAVAIEERPTIAGLGREMLNEPDGLDAFSRLGTAELDRFRADYWERAQRAAQSRLEGKLFIDMDPFKGARLPFLARLFPAAKFVITRRDPRDVVWSCFHTNFAFNSGTATFGSLENTARHYAATWAIAEEALATIPMDWFELRYETLVRDFDATTRALCDFIGVEWSEEVRSFDRTAQRRGVSTASAAQVRQGLYDGSGGWRRYERQFESVLPILQPWIERFGYA
jgi:tetratricopeptide (TPR) repeat protein